MAFYSFGRIKIISRNGVKSAVATAAYHAAIKATNEYDGVTHDYSRKQNVGDTFIRMPESAPAHWRDDSVSAKERVATIWNDVEMSNKNSNARLARSNYIALPHDLTLEQGLECVDRFIQVNCTKRGMGVTYTVHDMPGNRHVDLMYLVSKYDKNGKPVENAKKEYFCRDKAGNEVYLDAAAFEKSEGYEKVYKYQKDGVRKDMTPSEAASAEGWTRINKYAVCRTVKVSGWDEQDLAEKWRKSWEKILNEKYKELDMKDRVDSRSYKDQGLDLVPTIHEGWGADREERMQYNAQVREFNREIDGLRNTGMDALYDIQEQVLDLQENEQTEESIEQHEMRFDENQQVLEMITESNLLSDRAVSFFKAKLDELAKWMDKLLVECKERLRKVLRERERVKQIGAETKKVAKDTLNALEDLIAEAVAERKRDISDAGRSQKKNESPDEPVGRG